MITQKEKDLTIALLTEKLERISGKKIVLEDNLFSSIDTPETLKSEILKEKQADIQTVKDLLKQYSTDIKVEDSGKVSGRAIGKDLYLLSSLILTFTPNDVYKRVFKTVQNLREYLLPKLLTQNINVIRDLQNNVTTTFSIILEYKKIIPISIKKSLSEAKEKTEFKSVVGIIFMGDYVVLGKALTQDDRNGKLVFPGGGIEEGETLEEACKREVFEESGLFVKVRKSKPIVLKDLPTVAFLLCDYSYGSLFFNEEYSEIGWYPLSDLPMNKIYKNNLEILENLKKNSK